jgi:ATP-dependent Lon protease
MAITIHKRSKADIPDDKAKVAKEPKEPVENKALPLVSLRGGVVFPHTETVLVFGRPASQKAVEFSVEERDKYLVVTAQKKDELENPTPAQMYVVGTLVKIERTLQHEGEIHALVRGIKRIKIREYTQTRPFPLVTVDVLPETFQPSETFEAELKHLASLFQKMVQKGKPVEFFNFMKLAGGIPSRDLVDHIASTLEMPTKDKQRLLEELDINKRVKAVTSHLSHEQRILDIEHQLESETRKQLDERMRENILRERMQAIQKELGDFGDEEAELEELDTRLAKAKMPPTIEKKVAKEIKRLRQMSPMHSEYSYVLSWVETMLELPWNGRSRTRTSLKKAAKILDEQHYGLEKVKERVLEHLAVMKLKQANEKEAKAENGQKEGTSLHKSGDKKAQNNRLPTILCFVGPPGVGKTSIGRSIAEALGRDFVKMSLGGVHDEAEIRGHRRTYVGAMPGRVIQTLSQAGTKNPVFILDEIDKVSSDFRGDPSAALLEVLDPEQNHEFQDHYLGVPFDLSEVMFIATANVLDTIPGPLRDRLEIVYYSGYTQDEKFHIARQYLLTQAINSAGLKPEQISIPDDVIRLVIHRYTREAGVRTLKRELSSIARKAARQIAESGTEQKKVLITTKNIEDFLGPAKYLDTELEAEDQIGLVNGLAWTSVGGEILQIEAALAAGKEGFTLTGQLGDVMKESARAAYTFVRSHAEALKIDPKTFEKNHIHVHVPEGAVPKDGPSAGVAMSTVLASVYGQKPIRRDIAMTGEVTLRGRVLPIGGLKEKMIAAHRAGIKTVFIPQQNVKDLVEIPEKIKKDLEIVPVDHVDQVLQRALIG